MWLELVISCQFAHQLSTRTDRPVLQTVVADYSALLESWSQP